MLTRCFCLLLILGMTLSQASAAELRAGVARVDITPPQNMNCALGGFGERMNKPAEGIHDRIFAKALVVSDGTHRFTLVTADLLGFPPPFKGELLKQLADPLCTQESLILLPSHSHGSIETNAFHSGNDYKILQLGLFNPPVHKLLLEKFTAVIREASQKLVPVQIGTSSDQITGWNRNRRHQGGYTDNELTVTRIDTLDGKSLAVLINFTAHPTFMLAEQMMFSGDWPGHLQRTVESLIGPETMVMYYNGAEGDQAPNAPSTSGNSRWEKAEYYGRDLGIIAWNVWKKTPVTRDVPFEYHRQEIELPSTSWHPKFMETGGAEYGLTEAILKEMLPRMFPKKTASVSVRLGDLLVVGVPGEMIAELGRTIKQETGKRTGASHPVIGGLADEWDSYILTASEYRAGGGYEASMSFYGETLGQTILDGALKGIDQYQPKKVSSAVPAEKPSEPKTSQVAASPRQLKVAVAQMRSSRNLAENVAKTKDYLAKAAKQNARVVVFPECSLSGYFDNAYMQSLNLDALADAERQVAEACREHKIYALIGNPTPFEGKLYNSAVVIDPAGQIIERYHKMKLAERWPISGDHLSVFRIDGVPCSIIVCHDERYPELVRLPVMAGSRVVFYLSHESGITSEKKIGPYRAQIQARAVENSVYVLHANAPANPDTSGSHGQSRVIDPDGNIVKEGAIFDEELLIQTLDLPKATGKMAQLGLGKGALGDWYREGLKQVRIVSQ